jgi:short-subunit dehydrogenase involved in D-alanine esterification of teichoic acids
MSIVLITGAATGIGRLTAQTLAAAPDVIDQFGSKCVRKRSRAS